MPNVRLNSIRTFAQNKGADRQHTGEFTGSRWPPWYGNGLFSRSHFVEYGIAVSVITVAGRMPNPYPLVGLLLPEGLPCGQSAPPIAPTR